MQQFLDVPVLHSTVGFSEMHFIYIKKMQRILLQQHVISNLVNYLHSIALWKGSPKVPQSKYLQNALERNVVTKTNKKLELFVYLGNLICNLLVQVQGCNNNIFC